MHFVQAAGIRTLLLLICAGSTHLANAQSQGIGLVGYYPADESVAFVRTTAKFIVPAEPSDLSPPPNFWPITTISFSVEGGGRVINQPYMYLQANFRWRQGPNNVHFWEFYFDGNGIAQKSIPIYAGDGVNLIFEGLNCAGVVCPNWRAKAIISPAGCTENCLGFVVTQTLPNPSGLKFTWLRPLRSVVDYSVPECDRFVGSPIEFLVSIYDASGHTMYHPHWSWDETLQVSSLTPPCPNARYSIGLSTYQQPWFFDLPIGVSYDQP